MSVTRTAVRATVGVVAAAVAAAVLAGGASPASAAVDPAGTTHLRKDQQLEPGGKLTTPNGFTLVMQDDGNLVEYAPGDRPVWASRTDRAGSVLRMQGDGNLVVVAPDGEPVWASGTDGTPGAGLHLQTDGRVAVIARGHVLKWVNRTRSGQAGTAPRSRNTGSTQTGATGSGTTGSGKTGAGSGTGAGAGAGAGSRTGNGNRADGSNGTGTSGTNGTGNGNGNGSSNNSTADQVVTLTNAERAEAGCGALRSDPALTKAAQGHSDDMARTGSFDHTSQDGRTFDQRIKNAGYSGGGLAENIAKGQNSPEDVVRGWMNSPGHRANILNCDYRSIGVGYAADGNVWTQDFGTS